MPLDPEQIEALLAPKLRKIAAPAVPKTPQAAAQLREQVGPIRWYDKEMRCMNGRGHTKCGSPTYIRFQGIPNCMIHAVQLANELLVEKGVLN